MWIYIVLILILVLFYWWKNVASAPCDNFPPGPMGLPIIGYLPVATDRNILVALDKIHDVYGKIVSVNLGPSKRIVVIGDYDILKEAFKDDKLNSRPLELMWANQYFRFGNGKDSRGLIFTVVKMFLKFLKGKRVTDRIPDQILFFVYRVKNGQNNEDLHYVVSAISASANPQWKI